jgi:signal transduction histidine kinase
MVHGGYFVSHRGSGDVGGVGVLLVALSTLPLAAWRRGPFVVFVATGAANVVLAAVVYPIGVPLGPAVALYLLAADRDATGPSIAQIGMATAMLLLAYGIAAGINESTFPTFELLHAALLLAVAWLAGERTRLRREQVDELRREAQRERLLAAAEERARIARDLHDSAGHAINVIAVRAGAARLRHNDDPARSIAALEAIEDLARRTAADIDHIVGALRDRDASDVVQPPPGLASLETLVGQHRGAGLVIECTTSGEPRPLPSSVDQSAYRVIQEALTNASRYGSGSAHVDVRYSEKGLELRVTNPVAPARTLGQLGSGHGLVGMHERAELLGGSVAIERSGCKFSVCARLPFEIAS